MSESPPVTLPRTEATLLAIWRRVVEEGGGPELTLAEAAALLGTSVESVKRRIKSGQLFAHRDERGRLRVVPFAQPVFDTTAVARLWEELKAARRQLKSTQAERRTLQEDLDSTRQSLELVQTELSAMWRVMSKRQGGASIAPPAGVSETKAGATTRIESQIAKMRKIARRRRWFGALAG